MVPDSEQRGWRTMTRGKLQPVRDRVRLQNQLEALLEGMRIKLSSVISDLLGVSGRRIPIKLAELGDDRLKCSKAELADALSGHGESMHRQMLKLFPERLEVLDRQIQQMDQMTAEAMKKYADAVIRLAETPGLGPDSARQIIAEVGPEAKSFDSPAQFASWVGTCPGSEESAEQNHSSRSAKGNRYLRRILTQAAQAAVKKKGSYFQIVFRRWISKLGYQGAIWAIAHKLSRLVWKILHDGVHYEAKGEETNAKAKNAGPRRWFRHSARWAIRLQDSPSPRSPRGGNFQGSGIHLSGPEIPVTSILKILSPCFQ